MAALNQNCEPDMLLLSLSISKVHTTRTASLEYFVRLWGCLSDPKSAPGSQTSHTASSKCSSILLWLVPELLVVVLRLPPQRFPRLVNSTSTGPHVNFGKICEQQTETVHCPLHGLIHVLRSPETAYRSIGRINSCYGNAVSSGMLLSSVLDQLGAFVCGYSLLHCFKLCWNNADRL